MPHLISCVDKMKRKSLATNMALSLAAALLVGCQTSADNKVSIDYYQISGNSTAALDAQIKSKGPKVGGDRHAIAVARIRMIPDIKYASNKGSCAIQSADVAVNARVTLPEWKGRAQASPELGAVWDNIDRYARIHESVHVSIAFNYAKQMKDALEKLPARRNCEILRRESKNLIGRLLRLHDASQRKFDSDEQSRILRSRNEPKEANASPEINSRS